MSAMDTIKLKTPDKVIGGILIIVALAVFGVVGYVVLPFLIAAAANTMIFLAELAGLVLMAMVLFDKSFWTGIYYGWKNVSRKIRKFIVREDPIGVFDTVIQRFYTRIAQIDDNIKKAVGAYKNHTKSVRLARAIICYTNERPIFENSTIDRNTAVC